MSGLLQDVGIVVIGRNEGVRLIRCLSAPALQRVATVVYVDSGSTDGSLDTACSLGADCLELDMSVAFTAARARNAGFVRLLEQDPGVRFVQMVDGDCELVDGWLEQAVGFLENNPEYAAVAGRLKERFPDRSVYNYLCDAEWNTPVGDTDACGGIAMMRVQAFDSVGGFMARLIAGEEPELCLRLRQNGWKIRRLATDMALHDAAMSRFSQWWKRAVRGGHAYAEGAHLHGAPPERMWVKESRRIVAWGLLLPTAAVSAVPFTQGFSLLLLLAYPFNVVRIARRLRAEGQSRPWTLAFFLMLLKFPQAVGWLRFQRRRLIGKRSMLIEYRAK